MFNLLSLYLFLSSIFIGFLIKYLLLYLGKWIDYKKYIIPIFLAIFLGFNITYIIPTSLVYNNNPFLLLSYGIIITLIIKYIDQLELNNGNQNDISNKTNNKFYISDSFIMIIGTLLYILYIISLFVFNLSFYENINLGKIILTTLLNGFLLSLYFIFSRNNLKNDLITLGIIFIIGLIELYLFTQTKISSYFLPNISYTLQSFLGFLSLFFTIHILYSKKYINTIFIISFLLFFILFKFLF